LVTAIAETDTAATNEYHYYFDVLVETDKVYVITSNGEVTQQNVTPDSPAALTFIDVASPEYFVKLTDLASAKEKTLARKMKTVNRALNMYESYKLVYVLDAAVQTANQHTLGSGITRFNYKHLVDMIQGIIDYADGYVLIVSAQIDSDIKLWDWNDNKYTSLAAALKDLNVTIIRQTGSVTIDGNSTAIIGTTKAYLVGTSTEAGRPLLFVRKQLNDIDLMGGSILASGDKPQRLVFISPNPVHSTSGSNRYLAVGMTGFEEIAIAATNPYALACFTRA
jgi:hypothetical protein